MTLTWLVAHTNAGAESMARAELIRAGYVVLWLHRHVTVRHANREHPKLLSLFPGYLFGAYEPGQSVQPARCAVGIDSVLRADGLAQEPLRAFVEKWIRDVGMIGCLGRPEPSPKGRHPFVRDELVKVLDGPFLGECGTVEVDNGDLVKVWLRVFRGRWPAWIEARCLSPVEQGTAERGETGAEQERPFRVSGACSLC